MNLTVVYSQGRVPVTVLAVEGSLDGSNFREVIARAEELYQAGTRSLLLDLSHMPYMSSSGIVALHSIAVLLHTGKLPDLEDGWSALHAVADESGGLYKEIKLLNPQPRVDHTLEMAGMKRYLEITNDLTGAIKSF